MANTIKFKRGNKANLPALAQGEPAFVKDEKELYIGTDNGNEKVTSKSEIDMLNAQVGTKVGGVHYHGVDMIVGLLDKLSAIDTKISDIYAKIGSTPPASIDIVSVDEISDITIASGTDINTALPTTVWVTLSDNTRVQKNVTWGAATLVNVTSSEEVYNFEGSVAETTIKAYVKVKATRATTPTTPVVILEDNFDRVNNATTLGGSWLVENDAVWGIESNQAKLITDGTTGNNVAVVEANENDVTIEVDCLHDTSQMIYNSGIAFRYTNNNNFFHVVIASNTLELRKYVGGVSSVVGSYGVTAVNGRTYKFKVVLNGDNIAVLLDGEQRIVATDSFNNTATKHGLRSYTGGSVKGLFDNFKISTNETITIVDPPIESVYDVIANGGVGNGTTENAVSKFSTTLPNYIQSGYTVAMSADTYRALTVNTNRTASQAFTGGGLVKILNFQVSWEVKSGYPQGTVYTKDMSDSVIMAMNLPNEGVPYNAQQKQQRGGSYSYPVLRSDIVSVVPWAQLFLKTGSSFVTGSYVNIENFTIVVYRNSTQKWEILGTSKNGEVPIYGKWYDVNFSEDGVNLPMKNANYTTIPNGIRLSLDNTDNRYGFHFWMYKNDRFRFSVVPSDIKYMVTYADITAEDATAASTLVVDVGCDAYTGTNGSGSIYEVGVGGFINVKTTKRRCYFTSLGYNNYFTYCNQQLIDSLT